MLKPTKHWLIHFLWSKSEIETFFQICPKYFITTTKGSAYNFLHQGKIFGLIRQKHSPSRQSGGLKLAYDPNIFLNHLHLKLYGLAFIKDIFSFITSFISKILSHLHLGQHNTESLQTPLPHTPSQ